MKIEITKNNPPVISWRDKTGWVKRVKVTRKSLKECGYKYSFLAEKLGISYQAFRNKIDNKSEFLPTQIEKLCDLLSINSLELKNDIFFALFVE